MASKVFDPFALGLPILFYDTLSALNSAVGVPLSLAKHPIIYLVKAIHDSFKLHLCLARAAMLQPTVVRLDPNEDLFQEAFEKLIHLATTSQRPSLCPACRSRLNTPATLTTSFLTSLVGLLAFLEQFRRGPDC